MDNFLRIVSSSLRRLTKAPGFTALVIIPLTIGIGANISLFSIFYSVLLRPLPYANPEQLVSIWETFPQAPLEHSDISPSNYFDLAQKSRSFSQIGAATPYWSVNLTGVPEPEKLSTEIVTASLFRVLGVSPAVGGVFTDAEDLPGGRKVVLLSNAFWHRRFGGDPSVVGRGMTLDGQAFTVIGVMPTGFSYLSAKTDIYLPLSFAGDRIGLRSQYFLRAVARLKPGTSEAQARAEIKTIGSALAQEYRDTNAGRSFDLALFQESVVGGVRPTLRLLLGIVGFVLLIACANVANLLSIRAVARQREFALRTVLGAPRGRIVGELLLESLLLSLIGGALGLFLAAWAIKLFSRVVPADLPRAQDIGIGWPVILFTLGLSVVTALIFGLIPALQSARTDLNETLKQGTKSSSSVAGRRFRDILATVEVALAIVLLIGAGLLMKSFLSLRSVSPGYDPQRVLTFDIVLPDAKYATYQQRHQFFENLTESLATSPGVTAVGGINYPPLSPGSASAAINIEGRPTPPGTSAPEVDLRTVTAGYFQAMHIPLLAGRSLTLADRAGATRVVLINKAMRDRFWPGEDPLGKRLQLGAANPAAPWYTISGVVGSVRAHGLATEPSPEVYIHLLQTIPAAMTMVLRTDGDPAKLAPGMSQKVWALDPDLPVSNVSTLETQLSGSISRERLLMILLACFAVVALILGVVGVYGVISYSVLQRTREIGIRMALGAQPKQVLWSTVIQAMTLALIGVVCGLVGAAVLSRFLNGIVYQVSPTDPAMFLGIAVLMSAAALLASYIPARRAMKVDPLTALRFE